MAYQALYRKYRPQYFSDVVGQEHITETLKNELAHGKTVHAYLFTGTRGTGKTTCAKILAKAVNCVALNNGDPCLQCESCLSIDNGENTDIVEIDAASNNGVDNIRELRELISFAPASSKYRVFIIDEVHMLSIGAFNALLKTLEEPPAHVVFILATTEVHKLPATILSRCQRFDFRRIDSAKICERIQYIAEKEGLTVTDDAATLIAAAADGGMRDALSILDLCASSSKNIDEATVESVCAMAGNDYLLNIADAVKAGDTEKALLLVDKLHNSSVDMLRLLTELTSHYRDLMIVKTVKGKNRPVVCSAARLKALETQAEQYDIKDIIYALTTLQSAFAAMQTGNRRCEMEMALIRMCDPSLSPEYSALERRVSALERGIKLNMAAAVHSSNSQGENETVTKAEPSSQTEEEIPPPVSEDEAPATVAENEASEQQKTSEDIYRVEQWNEVLRILATECPLIAGVLKDSTAYIKGAYLLIDAPNSQFRSLINSGNSYYRDSIRKAAFAVLGVTYKLGPYTKPAADSETDPLSAFADRLKNFELN
ncbi:MAG: DNA polymerase III subunit gamma/tau [Clostridia bacterium]|nr:DNA polymerase III subunit gamma/tau [Clostridia bacterium]